MLFNVNEKVRVKLTDAGIQELRKQHAEYQAAVPIAGDFKPPETDVDGWSEFQLWALMRVFGAVVYNGCKVPFETTIDIPTPTAANQGKDG